jgi:hypothetical protein
MHQWNHSLFLKWENLYPVGSNTRLQMPKVKPCRVISTTHIRRRYNGKNNGEISLSVREAAIAGNCGKSSAQRHLESLVRHGFIALNNKGMMRNRYASTWFLTAEKSDHDPSYPTDAWKRYQRIEILATVPRLKLCMG